MAPQVFISYATEDKEVAEQVLEALEGSGMTCWIAPRDIRGGATYAKAIADALQTTRAFVLIFSAHAVESPDVENEVHLAFKRRQHIVPFCLDDTPLSPALEYYLGKSHRIDTTRPPLNQHLEQLIEATRSELHDAGQATAKAPETTAVEHEPSTGATAEKPVDDPLPVIVDPPRRVSPWAWLLVAGGALALIAVLVWSPRGNGDLARNVGDSTGAPEPGVHDSSGGTLPIEISSRYMVRLYTTRGMELVRQINADSCIVYAEHHFDASSSRSYGAAKVIVASDAASYVQNWARWYARAVQREFNVPLAGDSGIFTPPDIVRPTVLEGVEVDAMLVEPLVISNPQHANWIRSESGRTRLARVLAESIVRFYPSGGLVCLSHGHGGDPLRPSSGNQGYASAEGGTEATYSYMVLLKTKEILERSPTR